MTIAPGPASVPMAEYVFRLLPEDDERQIRRRIASDSALAREEGLWIDVVGSMVDIRPDPVADGPVPDVLPAINARLFGETTRQRRAVPWLLVAGLVIVLVAKAHVLLVILRGM
ncbi:hypothetical protein [Gemmobacter sp.]|uniref:hypothetical protein n=1 Tax=Gemmobacter sp. TaxID=1898957 RepID=UPI002AFE4FBD|nr:hypothetical protein [Gemmobacter sp.]